MSEDGSLIRTLSNVISVTQKKGEGYEKKFQADCDSIMEYAAPMLPLLKEMIAFPCHHLSQGNCELCFNTKVLKASRLAAEKGWELTQQYGRRQLSESTKKLMEDGVWGYEEQ